ncbi:MAG: ChbG/HpnK family deacetylase [Candidatus Moranbacteria bacterium]|nr:ChbG/HpnK family deacetylase [Candidatus Moranbacteria bacterium]
MPFLRKKVIVSVDDFGIRKVADAILPLAKEGKIDRVSVLINYVTDQNQVAELLATGVKIDLHLELIDLIKSGSEAKESAVFRGVNFAFRYVFGLVNATDVERSWTQQIERFKEVFGRYPDGLNSHEHVHYFPRFFKVALMLRNRYHIPFVRFARCGILEETSSVVARILVLLWKKNTAVYAADAESKETSDFFVSYDWIADFDSFIQGMPEGRTEIVFHPERKIEYDVIESRF